MLCSDPSMSVESSSSVSDFFLFFSCFPLSCPSHSWDRHPLRMKRLGAQMALLLVGIVNVSSSWYFYCTYPCLSPDRLLLKMTRLRAWMAHRVVEFSLLWFAILACVFHKLPVLHNLWLLHDNHGLSTSCSVPLLFDVLWILGNCSGPRLQGGWKIAFSFDVLRMWEHRMSTCQQYC